MAVQTAVLRTLYASGLLATILMAPQAAKLLRHLDRGKVGRDRLYSRIRLAQNRLIQRGYIETKDGRFLLTKKGKASIELVLLKEYRIPDQTLWDGKWRMLLFDIHERRRKVRWRLRNLLIGAGFIRLQDSAWIYPYPCDEFVSIVRAHLASGVGELRSFTCEALESDAALRKHFNV